MATNTYVALDKKTVTTSVASVEFTGISQAYTDLIVVINAQTSSDTQIRMRLNSDAGTNYSSTVMAGDGSTQFSIRVADEQSMNIGGAGTQFGTTIINLNNYSNTTTLKTVIADYKFTSSSYGETGAKIGTWRNTNAITSILFLLPGAFTYSAGSTFSLYGIAAEGIAPAPKATGGAIYDDSLYYYHVFGQTGTFTPNQALTADILTIAGGGSGGLQYAGGGGSGGLVFSANASLNSGTTYTCTIGAGAAKAVDSGTRNGTAGSNSTFAGSGFSTITANGGGYGGGDNGNVSQVGGVGGSGGGGTAIGSAAGGAGSQLNNGGAGGGTSTWGGGGGGATEVGNTDGGGFGGDGTSAYSSWGLATGTGENINNVYFYAGGGGGSAVGAISPAGGAGGGGNGGKTLNGQTGTTSGMANTGGGGGAGWGGQNDGGAGGSGLIIVRYLKA
jgi:hypothetical protein